MISNWDEGSSCDLFNLSDSNSFESTIRETDLEYLNNFFGNSSEDDNFAPESISTSSSSESAEMDCKEMSNLINDMKAPAESQAPQRKSVSEYSQEEYEQILQYKIDPSKLNLSKEEREKLRKRARTFDFLDDGTNEPWPKGKILHKILSLRNGKRKGSKLFVPPNQVDHVIKHFHSQGSNKHSGWNRTFKVVRKDHMGISEIAVREYVKSCAVCLKFETVRKKPRLKPILSCGVMDRMQIDLKEFEFYEEENDGFRYMLTVVDHFSGFPWAFPLRSKTAEEVANHLVQLFLVIGPPRILHSDNGGEFVNRIFDHISEIFHFKPAHGKAYNPREQGLVEKFNGTISVTLSKLMYEKNTYRWVDLLPEALFSYRITVGVTKKTPFEIFYLRAPNFVYSFPGTILAEVVDLEDCNEGDQSEVQELVANLIQDVREQREANAVKMKERWDTVNTQQVEVGQFVLVDPRHQYKVQPKRVLGRPLFFVPGQVIHVNPNGNIGVRWKDGTETPVDRPIPNNKFKVVAKEVFDSALSEDIGSTESDVEEISTARAKSSESPAPNHVPKALSDVFAKATSNASSNSSNPSTSTAKTSSISTSITSTTSTTSTVSTSSTSSTSTTSSKRKELVSNDYIDLSGVEWEPFETLKVEIYWKTSNKWFPGVVGRFSSSEQKWRIHYDDNDNAKHRFNPEKWRISTSGHSARNFKVIESWTKKKRIS